MTLAQNSVKSYLGVALETTKGTAVAATNFVPITLNSFKPVDVIAPLYDTGIRGSLVENYNYVQGRRNTTIDFGGPVFADTIGFWIAGVLGDVTTTGSSAPYTHVIGLKNTVGSTSDAQPKALTITDFYGANTRYYPGQQITDFGLTFNADGMLEYTVKTMGWASSTTTAPAPSFTSVLPTQVWTGVVTIGGTTVGYVTTGTLDLNRKSEAIWGLSGTQNPYQVFLGSLTAKGKLTFVMQDDTELTRYITNTQPALTVTFSTGSGSTATQVAFQLSKGAYVTGAIDRGTEHVTVSVDIEGLGNTTDVGATGGYSPVQFTLKNAFPASTFQ
jgi:hypothetical protein